MDRSHKKCRRLNEGSSLSKKENSFINPPPIKFVPGIFSFYHKMADKKRRSPQAAGKGERVFCSHAQEW